MRAMKKVLALIFAVVMAISLVGCGEISYDDITGEWTTKTIGDQTAEEYAEAYGTTVSMVASNFTITDDEKLVVANASASAEYVYERKSNGIEVKEEGKDDVLFSMTYDEDTQTFSYQVDTGNGTVTYVLEKGTTNLTAEDD
jgi:uncharacterized lipoprotein YehR (DUF1307 family)